MKVHWTLLYFGEKLDDLSVPMEFVIFHKAYSTTKPKLINVLQSILEISVVNYHSFKK